MPQQKQYKVLLIGDSCIDEYVYGSCERLNPEAPVPILNYKYAKRSMGMAKNVECNLKSFGLDVDLITHKEEIVKTRYIDERSNQQILRVDNDVELTPFDFNIPKIKYDALVISDYDKGFITQDQLYQLVKKFKGPIFIDSKKTKLPQKNCFIKINEFEYKKLEKKSSNIIVTRGPNGAEYLGKTYPTNKVDVFDVGGAGDTFLSALVAFYLGCGKIEESIPFANKAASIAVQHPGTYVLNHNDIYEIHYRH